MERQIDAIEKSKTELNEEVGKLQKRKEKLSKALGLKVANKVCLISGVSFSFIKCFFSSSLERPKIFGIV